MINTIKTFLLISTLLSLYTICSVGLSIMPLLGESGNSENINNVVLNLSYSYFAGFVFYIFISYLPQRVQEQKIKPVILSKYTDAKNQVAAFINSFNIYPQSNSTIDTITTYQISQLFKGRNLINVSFFSLITGGSFTNADYINTRKDSLIHSMNGILFYKEFLSQEQIVLLEQIKDHTFLQLFKVPFTFTDKTFLNNCAEQFSSLVELVREFEQTL